MKRFKTKQEFIKEYGDEFCNLITKGWNSSGSMDYLFGLPYTKEITHKNHPLNTRNCSWSVSDNMLTDAPHPYKNIDVCVKVNNEEQSKRVQLKAFELGYAWGCGKNISYTGRPFLFFWRDNRITWGRSHDDQNGITILSYQQFMDGNMPTEEKKQPHFSEDTFKVLASNNEERKLILEAGRSLGYEWISDDDDDKWNEFIFHPNIEYIGANCTSKYESPIVSIDELIEYAKSKNSVNKESQQVAMTNINQNQKQNGNTIKVRNVTSSIRRGERKDGCAIQGGGSSAIIRIGHLSNKACACESRKGEDKSDSRVSVRRKRRH